VGDIDGEGVPERDAVEVRHMVGEPEGERDAEAHVDGEGVWLALAVADGERVGTVDALVDAEREDAAEPVPEPQGDVLTVKLTRGEVDTEGVVVMHAVGDVLRLTEGDADSALEGEGRVLGLGEPLPVGAALLVAAPVRDTEGLADTVAQDVLDGVTLAVREGEDEAVFVGQGVGVRESEALPEEVAHEVAVAGAVALPRALLDTEGEPVPVAAMLLLADRVPLPLTEVEREGEPVIEGQLVGLADTVTLTVTFGVRVCVPLTEGEDVAPILRVGDPDAEEHADWGAEAEEVREEEPQGEVLTLPLSVGGRGVADTEGLEDTERVSPPDCDTEELLDTVALPLPEGGPEAVGEPVKDPVDVGVALGLPESVGDADPLRLPLPLFDTLPQPVPLSDDSTLPVEETLKRVVLDTDALTEAERDTV
jgi:hypothetical protein